MACGSSAGIPVLDTAAVILPQCLFAQLERNDKVFDDRFTIILSGYLEKLLPKMRPGGLIVAHNMSVRQARPPFFKAMTTNPDLETPFVYMDHAGVAISMKKR